MDKTDDKTDIDELVADIRRNRDEAVADVPEAVRQGLVEEQDLYGNLSRANAACASMDVGGGPMRLVRKVVVTLLRPLIGKINTFQLNTIKVLNQLVRILDGRDTTLASELAGHHRQRVELLTQLNRRLDAYDAMDIEARLARLETSQNAPGTASS